MVTPVGMFTVVKLNTPLAGIWSTVFAVGSNAPSAPVLPLSNAAWARQGASSSAAMTPINFK